MVTKNARVMAVFSDSHGNDRLLNQALKTSLDLGAEILVHLGDYYGDLDGKVTKSAKLIQVPGLFCPEFKNPFIERVRKFRFGDWLAIAVHDKEMAPQTSDEKELLLYGHTHHANLVKMSNKRWGLNPGHLKAERDRGCFAGFAVAELLNSDELLVSFYSPKGKVIKTYNTAQLS